MIPADFAKYLAKPTGISLAEHTANVLEQADVWLAARPFVQQRYQEKTGADLAARLRAAALWHDIGKKHKQWQDACRQDYTSGGGLALRKGTVRHEIYSLLTPEVKKAELDWPTKAAIGAHHNNLRHGVGEKWQKLGNEGIELWRLFAGHGSLQPGKGRYEKALSKIYEYAGVRGLLQLADHRASAMERDGPDVLPDFQSFKYQFPHTTLRAAQQLIAAHWQELFLLLRAPTGSGKTDAALLWAQNQIENGRADRLVIAMPTRFTSNALAINVAGTISDTGLYHSSAWHKLHQQNATKQEKERARKTIEFARLLETPVTVCTIDHLLAAFTLTREDHHLILFNLAHACVVIDEADFYDEFVQANIQILLEVLTVWKVPVLIMSASLPESSKAMYAKSRAPVGDILKDDSEQEKVRCRITRIESYDVETNFGIDDILSRCLKQPSIIYANTVASAQRFYDWFAARGVEPLLYHSRFTEPDKVKKEACLLKMMGKDAWKRGEAKGVAIMTQIGEMSVNISAEYMVSEVCPIDRLTQRIGRLSRFEGQVPGELVVLIPQKKEALYPAPYGSYDRSQGWRPGRALEETIHLLEQRAYTTRELVEMVNQVYTETTIFPEHCKNNANQLKDFVGERWLIRPCITQSEEDTENEQWKSRDIEPTMSVFAGFLFESKEQSPIPKFDSWSDFNSFAQNHAIEIPIYLGKQLMEKRKMPRYKVHIGLDDEKEMWDARGFYTYERGLIMEPENMDPCL